MGDFNEKELENIIYDIGEKKVVLDYDLAVLFECDTKDIRKAVKKNAENFPERFCFQLTENELENLKSQFVTSSLKNEKHRGDKDLPYAFTAQGICMLSYFLNTESAINMSINIIEIVIKNGGGLFGRIQRNDK